MVSNMSGLLIFLCTDEKQNLSLSLDFGLEMNIESLYNSVPMLSRRFPGGPMTTISLALSLMGRG